MDQVFNKIVGIDISLNHLGICLLDSEGRFQDYAFLTDTKKFVTADPEHGELYKHQSSRSDHPLHFQRIGRFEELVDLMLSKWCSDGGDWVGVAVEGYALNSKNTRLYETAELTGAIKRTVVRPCQELRIHDPDTVKMFAVDYGHAKKDQIYDKFEEETGESVPTTWLKQGQKRELSGPGTDVADAYFLARLLWTENQVRTGRIKLQDLPPFVRKILLRQTKTYPQNLLERPYC